LWEEVEGEEDPSIADTNLQMKHIAKSPSLRRKLHRIKRGIPPVAKRRMTAINSAG